MFKLNPYEKSILQNRVDLAEKLIVSLPASPERNDWLMRFGFSHDAVRLRARDKDLRELNRLPPRIFVYDDESLSFIIEE